MARKTTDTVPSADSTADQTPAPRWVTSIHDRVVFGEYDLVFPVLVGDSFPAEAAESLVALLPAEYFLA